MVPSVKAESARLRTKNKQKKQNNTLESELHCSQIFLFSDTYIYIYICIWNNKTVLKEKYNFYLQQVTYGTSDLV